MRRVANRFPVDVPFLPRGGRSDDEIRALLEEVAGLLPACPPERRGVAVETMGDLLLLLGQREKALLAYEEELRSCPERFLFAAQKVLALDPARAVLALDVADRYLAAPDPARAAAWYEAAGDAAREAGREDLAERASGGLEQARALRDGGAGPGREEVLRQGERLRKLIEEGRRIAGGRDGGEEEA
jgi:tetratricopeptide (TPR) repeat protein